MRALIINLKMVYQLKISTSVYLLIIFLTSILLHGCGSKKKEHTEYLIGFSQCVGSDAWRKTMSAEIQMELSLHPGAKLVYSDANGNSNTQIEQVKEMLRQGIDLLIISPNEARPLTPIVELVYKKGIPVIIIDRKTSSNAYTAYVGADNFQIGKMAGQYIGAALNGGGNIIEIMGLPGSSPAIERQRGFTNGLREFKNIHIIHQLYGDWLKSNAEQQLLKVRTSFDKVDAIFAHNDVMANGAKHMLNELKISRPIKVFGIDALPGPGGGLELVSNKVLDASFLYPTGGKEAITIAFNILNREPFAKENILGSLVIDSSNVELMKLQWNKISSQHQDIERQQDLLEDQEILFSNQQVVLNITIIALVLAVVFGGLAFYSLIENRKINKRLNLKNAEILRQRNQLMEMSTKAQLATEAKLNFFTNISHEFRTPLTLILSPLTDLMQNEKLKSIAGVNLNHIHKNVFRLLKLVNQLITYRKIEYENMKIHASPNNIVAFIKDIMDSFQPNALKQNINLSLTTKSEDITVWFDANMLDKVIFNLLANAFKFTKANGTIHVLINDTDGHIIIEVQDNGLGMSQAESEHIFEHFYQVDTNSTKGSGLGLSLSKEIMQLHHGGISVASIKDQGTTFSLKLLSGSSHFNPDEISNSELNREDLIETAKIYTAEHSAAILDDLPDTFLSPHEQSVLIVEDNPDLLNYLKDKLSGQYEVFTACTGNDGLNAAYEKVPDLIISDVVMPGISGKELSQKLKSDVRTSHIPVILLTARGSIEHQIQGIEAMADAYIVKPFDSEVLLARVKNLLDNRVLLKAHYMSDVSTNKKLPVSKTLDKKFLNDFAGIVEENLSNENFNVDDICRSIGISRVQLYRKVKALLNCSITDYILSRRLKKARYLLVNESYSISEITYMVGFSTPNYFSTVFKAKYNCTPSEFKKKHLA
jgi:signal transduction histidine kinase/DNA-binding response OmpR family regulator/ABC-type xylose transport system substrate-binding protein